ncbi:MAG: hypothetical protein LBC75_01895 [Fibromonadaceae bacterium]|jgi:uncharacterized protein (TIGR02145 family)|nr:hypothetical protein [Fibromonadaceae bacterium]
MNGKIALLAGLGLVLVFTYSCFPEGSGISKNGCIRTELGVKANTLDDVAAACDATRGEVLSQISNNFGSCSKNNLDFDKPIRDVVAACGVSEIPIISGASSSSKKSSSSSGSCDIGKTVIIGTQTWAAKNLNCNITGSKCYGDDPANCEKYGRLYNYATAMRACPKGWHVPNNAEWDKLYRSVDGTSGTESPYDSETAGEDLKSQSFAALLGGGGTSDGNFMGVSEYGAWWSASEYDSDNAYSRYIYDAYEGAYSWKDDKSYLLSIRCLRD